MKEIDGVLFEVSALAIVLDDHSDVLVSGHALRLAVGEAQIERPGDGSSPQVMRRESLFPFIEPGEPALLQKIF